MYLRQGITGVGTVTWYDPETRQFGALGHGIVVTYGLATGVFVGCVAVALAEILHTIPIIVDRFKIRKGVKYIIFSMALGKMFGNIVYFLLGYAHF